MIKSSTAPINFIKYGKLTAVRHGMLRRYSLITMIQYIKVAIRGPTISEIFKLHSFFHFIMSKNLPPLMCITALEEVQTSWVGDSKKDVYKVKGQRDMKCVINRNILLLQILITYWQIEIREWLDLSEMYNEVGNEPWYLGLANIISLLINLIMVVIQLSLKSVVSTGNTSWSSVNVSKTVTIINVSFAILQTS